ncbi:MAG: isoaspartyl peptidase/L-asparaginase, partial [Flavobacteriales bacterium]|nr:isoaspartyl peptidase/L-asparaginase [Flavobacteriales bacterium]
MNLSNKPFSLAIHGGAGTLLPDQFTPDLKEAYENDLRKSLRIGSEVLKNGGTALRAVIEAVKVLEDSPRFNAGKGSVFTHDGFHEMDASLMNGLDKSASAVCAVRHVQNPIELCREVMNTEFVMVQGIEADKLAEKQGLKLVSNDWFSTDFRKTQLEDIRHL